MEEAENSTDVNGQRTMQERAAKPMFLKIEIKKVCECWWLAPVVPATWEAKAGGSFEPKNSRAAWLEIDNPTQKCINKMDTLN